MEKMMSQEPAGYPNSSNSIDQIDQNKKEIHRTRRVGSITCGLMLVLYGILFMVHIIQPRLNYTIIFELWPLIMIFLGVEILVSCTRENQEKRKYVYDFAAVILIFIVAFFAMIMSAVSYYYDYYDRGYSSDAFAAGEVASVSGSEVFAAKDVNTISLNNAHWDIKVQPSEDNDIHVSYNGTTRNENVVRLNQLQDGLVIDIDETQTVKALFWWGRGYERIAGELILSIPQNDTKSLKLNNESGGMLLQDISCEELVLNSEYGDVKLENVTCAKSFSCENGSGDIKFQNISCEGLKLNNSYGNVKIDNISCPGFDFDNDSGNIQIANSSCGDSSLKNGSGKLEIDNTLFGDLSIDGEYGDISLKNLTAKDTDITTDSGNIEMSDSSIEAGRIESDSASLIFNGVLAKYMDINSTYGDVNVKNADIQTETAISSESGNVSIRYRDKPEDNTFDVKSEYGNIRLRLENTEYDYNLETEKRLKIGNGTYHTKIVTDSGSITLE